MRSAVWLNEGAREAVHALKYGGLPRIAEDLADLMARIALPVQDCGLLVPIPLAVRRMRERGYNQADWLAAALARRWRRPVARNLLVRLRETASQTALTPGARLANVAGAFEVRNAEVGMRDLGVCFHSAFRNPHSTFVLVDDVFTTGATLAEAARALERAGARSVAGITFGRAVIPDFT